MQNERHISKCAPQISSVISYWDVIERLNGRFSFRVQFPAFVEHKGFYLTDIQNCVGNLQLGEIDHILLIFKTICAGTAEYDSAHKNMTLVY